MQYSDGLENNLGKYVSTGLGPIGPKEYPIGFFGLYVDIAHGDGENNIGYRMIRYRIHTIGCCSIIEYL